MPAPIYTVGPGRLILRDGLPAFYVERIAPDHLIGLNGITPEGGTHGGILTPTEADQMARTVAALLTEHARQAYLAHTNPTGRVAWAVQVSEEDNGPIAVDLIGVPGLDAHILLRDELQPGAFRKSLLMLLDLFKSISPNEMKSARQHRRTISRPVRIPRNRKR